MDKSKKHTGHSAILLILILSCIFIIGLMPACQPSPQAQTPPAAAPPVVAPPAPPSNPPPVQAVTPGTAIKWVADGVISAGE
ncbi:MAG: hypothetical protein NTY79_04590, partial [Chloroflexi bacterium]|nr:hypothetical protein [Chloroflexota bacterium]